MDQLSADELAAFQRDGYLLVPGLAPSDQLSALQARVDLLMQNPSEPLEYEADTGYPGAPDSRTQAGGRTVRRFLQALDRDQIFRDWAGAPRLLIRLRQILGPDLALTRAHHNCVMVKDPRYSSDTGWHQDIRYWHFDRPALVTALLALTPADEDNGTLKFLPGTHRLKLSESDFDEKRFFRPLTEAGRRLLETERTVAMRPGDVVLFHCLTLHAGPRNRNGPPRQSLLFTYHARDVRPLPDTRSAALPAWIPD